MSVIIEINMSMQRDQCKINRALLFCFFILIPAGLAAQEADLETGWKADPYVVKDYEEARPGFIWRETEVPDYTLPDPLLREDGGKVENIVQWQEQRKVLLDMLRSKMYGRSPGLPEELKFHVTRELRTAMDGEATLRRISIESRNLGKQHDFELILFLPNEVKKPVPVFLLMNNRPEDNTDPTREDKSDFWPAEEVIARGYGVAAIQNSSLAPDDTELFVEGIIGLFKGDAANDHSADAWGAISAWSWGAMRVMDYFETDDDVDESRIVLLGHSRGGKASLWAGAQDERFALVISNQSGSGGAALSRRRFGEDITALNRFTHWFNNHFKKYNEQEDQIPFDQHFLISLIAPRAVYIGSADKDLWADPRGEYLSLVHASPVFSLWNHTPMSPNRMPALNTQVINGPRAYHVRSGRHNLTLSDWNHYMNFADTLWPTRNR